MRPFFYPEERLIFYLEVLVKLSGAEFIIEALKKEGVTTVFGYPGGSVIPIFDALYAESDVHVVLTRHEQAAVHAADGYARSTGKTASDRTSGRATKRYGFGNAKFDSVPWSASLVSSSNMIGNDPFRKRTRSASRGQSQNTTTSSWRGRISHVSLNPRSSSPEREGRAP
jgi:hypothetical protein